MSCSVLFVLFLVLLVEWRSFRGYRSTLRSLEDALPYGSATIPLGELDGHLSGWFIVSEKTISDTEYVCLYWPSLLYDYRLWLTVNAHEQVGGLLSGNVPELQAQREAALRPMSEARPQTDLEGTGASVPQTGPLIPPLRPDLALAELPEPVRAAFEKAYGFFTRGDPKIDLNATLQEVAAQLPTLKLCEEPDKAVWNHMRISNGPCRFAAFRFSSTLDVPADLYWMFSFRKADITWRILPVQGTMTGFGNFDEVHSPQFQNSSVAPQNELRIQSLTGGEIQPGQDYIVWFATRHTALETLILGLQGGLRLNDGQSEKRQKQIKEVSRDWLIERNEPTPLQIALRLVPSSSPEARGAIQIAERVGEPFYQSPGGTLLHAGGRVISGLARSPDGQIIYAADWSKTIRAIELTTGKVRTELTGDQSYVRLAVSPDGKRLAAAASPSMRVALWDLENETQLPDIVFDWPANVWESLKQGNDYYASAIAPRFVGGSNQLFLHLEASSNWSGTHWYDVAVWDVNERKLIRRHSLDGLSRNPELSPDGSQLLFTRSEDLVAADGSFLRKVEVGRLDWATGESLPSFSLENKSIVYWKSTSPDGTMFALVITTSRGHEVQVRDFTSGEIRFRFSTVVDSGTDQTYRIHGFAWSPDSQSFALGYSDGSIRLWSVEDQRLRAVWRGHISTQTHLIFTPDGKFLISSGADGTIRQWETGAPYRKNITDSIGMQLVPLPAGEFTMGTPEGSVGNANVWNLNAERPAHRVRLTRPFLMGMHEVTVGQFRQFVDATGYQTTAEKGGRGGSHISDNQEGLINRPEFTWRNPGFTQGDDHPVVQVTLHDAQAFCKWLSTREQVTYRLPTEAEWEYACRAGNESAYTNSRVLPDVPDEVSQQGNVSDLSIRKTLKDYSVSGSYDDGFPWTAPVGRLHLNDFGLFDMRGNVFEWCSDYYDPDWYRDSPERDPIGPNEGVLRSQRGGAFSHFHQWTRSARREYGPPDQALSGVGFRVVREIPEKAESADSSDP